jgi:hypothetical protein
VLELAQQILAALIVLGAIVYQIGHFTGAFARFRRKRTPDVPVSRLVRKKDERTDDDDDCCR